MTTTNTRLKDFSLIVTLDSSGAASGKLYWDDGISLTGDIMNNFGSLVAFNVGSNSLSSSVQFSYYPELANWTVKSISIWGISGTVIGLQCSDSSVECTFLQTESVVDIECGKQLNLAENWTITWTLAPV